MPKPKTDQQMDAIALLATEMKAPMVTIKSFLELLREDLAEKDTEKIEEDVHHLRNAADRIDALLINLLRQSRRGAANLPVSG